jgi:hypothetical protein
MASEIAKIPEAPKGDFAKRVRIAVRDFPGNADVSPKTVDNWRTEISALFGFIEHDGKVDRPGRRAIELADSGDLISFFKTFLFNFQYPGAHMKSNVVREHIEAGIHFKPARYIVSMLLAAEKASGNREYITKAEGCWCIFNDLRITRDGENVSDVWTRITQNRENKTEYNTESDEIRYAGDIIDYMEMANLLVSYDNRTYYLNGLEAEAVAIFANSDEWFSGYDAMLSKRSGDLTSVANRYDDWFRYVNRDMSDTDFTTDILNVLAKDSDEYGKLAESSKTAFLTIFETYGNAKEIGDKGESIIYSHECERIRIGEREDLIHLIKCIPTSFAVGYDIQSVELDERKRYIEVKTTVSSKPVDFNRIHLTTNEWAAADTLKDRYYIYRLMISKSEYKLFLIQDPVKLYKSDVIQMIPRNGADISFCPDTAGKYEELLSWNG